MHPIGPAPVIRTSSPTRSNCSAVWVALPERIEAGEDVQRNRRVDRDGVGGRDAEVLREGPRSRFTPTPLVSLHRCRRPARQFRQTPHTMWPSPSTRSPWLESSDVGAHLLDHPDKLVADHHGGLIVFSGPRVPVVDVDVGAADRGLLYPDQHVVGPGNGHGDLRQVRAPGRASVWRWLSSSWRSLGNGDSWRGSRAKQPRTARRRLAVRDCVRAGALCSVCHGG